MSITIFGASLADSPATEEAIATATGEMVDRSAVPGRPISDWMARIPAAGTRQGDTMVVIESGGNGIATPEQLREADRRLRATGARRVMWVAFADWPDASRVAANRRATRDNIRANIPDVLVVPKPPVDRLGSDLVHFTATGYRELGVAIAQGLARRPGSTSSNAGLWVMGGLAVAAGFLFWKTAR